MEFSGDFWKCQVCSSGVTLSALSTPGTLDTTLGSRLAVQGEKDIVCLLFFTVGMFWMSDIGEGDKSFVSDPLPR